MHDSFCLLKECFEFVKSIGWVRSLRGGWTGIGYTFESLIGKSEDALCLPDFNGIEIKTHRKFSKSHICLFNYNPIGVSSYELIRIYNNYGYRSIKNRCFKVLNTSVYGNRIIDVGINYKFCLKVDYVEQKVFLMVFDRIGNFIEKQSYWDFSTIREKLYKKMQFLAYIEADNKFCNGVEFFKYNSVKFYKLKNFNTFLDLLDTGKIRVCFKVGVYTNGIRYGEINSHGTSFSINPNDLSLLYDLVYLT